MKILAISGSLRADSLNTKLLHAAGELADGEVEFEVWDGLKAVPPYDQDDEDGTPPFAVARLRSAIAEADAVLFATPEYNASIPGQLKNALDWVSRPDGHEPAAQRPGGGDRRLPRCVRSGLGAGRAEEGRRPDRGSRPARSSSPSPKLTPASTQTAA